MNINYGQAGNNRKVFVQAISNILDKPAVYQGAPTFAYCIDSFIIDRNGNLCCPDHTNKNVVWKLVASLQGLGYTPENYEELFPETAVGSASSQRNPEDKNFLIVEVPRTGITEQMLENIRKITASKASLLKLALDTDALEITVDPEKIYFPWFTLHSIEGEADAYSRLILAIVDMAKRQKRVTATEKPIENAKFSMRLFLIRLGFIGEEYRNARKILLRNLEGNSSWKAGRPPERPVVPVLAEASPITCFDKLLPCGEIPAIDNELFPEKGDVLYDI